MAQYTNVLKKSELASGEKKTVVVAGKHLMIANIGGEFFAIDDACTHVGCSLGTEGSLSGSTITCGCHRGQFNVTNGKVLKAPPVKDVQTYTVKVEGDNVLVLV